MHSVKSSTAKPTTRNLSEVEAVIFTPKTVGPVGVSADTLCFITYFSLIQLTLCNRKRTRNSVIGIARICLNEYQPDV